MSKLGESAETKHKFKPKLKDTKDKGKEGNTKEKRKIIKLIYN